MFFPEQCHFFVHVVTAVLYSHVIMAAISEFFSNIASLPYSLYIPSSLLNSLLDNNIMYKRRVLLEPNLLSHRNIGFSLGKKAKLNVYAMSMPYTVKFMRRQKYQHSLVPAIRNLSFSFFSTLPLNEL